MANKNYKSDFLLTQSLYVKNVENGNWETFDFPDFDFTLKYFTPGSYKPYEASCRYIDGEPYYTNLRNINGKIVVIFHKHNLNVGDLQVEINLRIPDDLFPDGIRTEILPAPTNIRLWDRPSDSFRLAEIKALIPIIKGKDGRDFSYEDLTYEQKKELADQIGETILEEAKKSAENSYVSLPEFDAEDILEALKDIPEFQNITPEDINNLDNL